MHPRAELLAPLRDPRAARRGDRGAERQQPLAEQRRDARSTSRCCSTSPRASPPRASATTGSCSSATAAARRCSPSTCTRRTRRPAGGSPHTAAGDAFDLNRFELPGADAMVYLAGHPGEGHYLLHAIDPSVVDEDDPVACDPDAGPLRPRATGSSRRPTSRGTPPASSTYRAAQRARVERIDAPGAGARGRPPARPRAAGAGRHGPPPTAGASIATDFMTRVPHRRRPARRGPLARPVRARLRLDLGRRPDWINYGAVGFGRVVSPGGVALDVVGPVVTGRDRRPPAAA